MVDFKPFKQLSQEIMTTIIRTADGATYTEEEWAKKEEAKVGKVCEEHNKVIKKGKYGNWCGGKDQFGRWCEGVVKK